MGKRSSFARRKNDAYDTWDARALPPLLPFLQPGTRFIEPCAGNGTLLDQLEAAGHVCVGAYDIEPRRWDIEVADACTVRLPPGAVSITNPPWTRAIMHPMLANLADQGPTWALFDAAWAFTRQAGPLLGSCHAIVVVGRLQWEPGTDHDSQDDCAWYLFGPNAPARPAFHGRGLTVVSC